MPKYLQLAGILGSKKPLVEGRTFVGRKREILKVHAALDGEQLSSLWIWGPRRIGKTSLTYRLPQNTNVNVVRVSCDQIEWNGFDKLIDFFASKVNKDQPMSQPLGGRDLLRQIANRSSRSQPLVIIADEFDRIAINLQQNEQAYMRSTLQEYPHFGFFFVTRSNPEQLLQNYSEENSNLIGVCEMLEVPLLKKTDIESLRRLSEEMCEEEVPLWIPNWVYELVAGYSVSVQTLMKEFFLLSDELGHIASHDELMHFEHRFFSSVEGEMKRFWNDLSIYSREFLLDQGTADKPLVRNQLIGLGLLDGDTLTRPKWLIRVSMGQEETSEIDSVPTLFALGERLCKALYLCNEIAMRRRLPRVFQTTQQVLRLYEIARSVDDENAFNERIGLLHKICYEDARSDKLKADDKWLVPRQVRSQYIKSKGIEVLISLRNFSFHDPSQDLDLEEVSKRYTTIAEIGCLYLGENRWIAKDKRDFEILYKGVLKDVVESVEALKAALETMQQSHTSS